MGEKYDDTGRLSSYRTSDSQFPNPEGMKTFPGYGANKDDLERGFCKPALNDLPEYDLDNYKQRWTQPTVSDLVEDGPLMPRDLEFRMKERDSKGFLERPHIPNER